MSDACIKSQTQFDVCIRTTEMHTAGEAVRIIESGYPVPQGKTLLEKINFLKKNYDNFRKLVIFEPRGHYDMFGVLLVPPDHPDADIAVIFMHNEGYATMCGHVVISLGRYAVDRGLIRQPLTSPETTVNIQCPCGVVRVFVQVDPDNHNKTGRVRFQNIPSFVVQTDVTVDLPGVGRFQVDLVYGGSFFAFVTARDVGVVFGSTPCSDISRLATKIKEAIVPLVNLSHPDTPAYLYGVIFVDSRDTKGDGPATNLCIFADAETDRSPCGSGTSARVTLMYHRGLLSLGHEHVFNSAVTGQSFKAKVVRDAGKVTGKKAVITEVAGQGYYSGTSSFMLEPDDVIGSGFLVR